MELQLVMVLLKLLDISTVLHNNEPHLIIIERDDDSDEVEKPIGTKWADFRLSHENGSWERQSTVSLSIPYCSTVKVTGKNEKISAICASNIKNALYLFNVPAGNKVAIEPVAVNISRASAIKVKIPPSGEWSTPYLPSRQNLFNEHLLPGDNNQSFVIANSADASAVIFRVDTTNVQELSRIERCIEPCIITVGENRMVFSRKCPKEWFVFYNLPDTRNTAELLPLVAYTLNEDFTVGNTQSLSNGRYTAASFIFDVCSTVDNTIVLATVIGLLNKPQLQILCSSDKGITWKERISIPLKEVPVRVRIVATESRILVACTFKHYDTGFHVMAAEFDR